MDKRGQNLYFLFQFTLPWVLLTMAFTTIAHLTTSGEGRKSGIVWLIISLITANFAGFCLFGGLFLPIFLVARKFNFETKQYFRNFLIHLAHGAIFFDLSISGLYHRFGIAGPGILGALPGFAALF